ncbi:regulatory protein MerR [Desulfurispirillum indicum S5]|uniref:Regulatory protein MerR n=1 Tax=Desulfurispirillum indicum (strain ATCC BAA-1389 / DSM 22839 / S5) TaxID=653733 RepID=E6W4S1_DESIS|nr:helix-turn-helix domain-containing protein [Desulfurispirillum indicum]ADU64799.1 regulatory protein MerR [Desulfurispirillum indicum S5]
MSQQQFVRIAEAADLLGVSRQCIYQYIYSGRLTKYVDKRHPKRIYVDMNEVSELTRPSIVRADQLPDE